MKCHHPTGAGGRMRLPARVLAATPSATTLTRLAALTTGTLLAGLPLAVLLLCAVASPPAHAAAERPRPERPSHARDGDRHNRAVHRVVRLQPDSDSDGEGGDDGEQKGKSGRLTKIGNGSRNNSIVSVKSPTSNKGIQHTQADSVNGSTAVLNALCRQVKVCNITLKVIMVAPEKAKKHTEKKSTSRDTTPDEDDCCCACETCDS
ncbi:hypothetical protein [Sphaerisporangium sp. NPDC051011]|uniref:hypothetical protein n=1 Tax=Sphaerisporangium sp. NPDC051011 TaxID=3155792 RepID=UPI0033C2F4EB